MNKFIVVTIGLTALGTLGWHIYTGTPRYSLAQLQEAIEKNRTDQIEDYIDVDSLSTQIVNATFNRASQSWQQQTGSAGQDVFGQLGASLGIGIMESMRPMIQQQIETYLDEVIRQPSKARLEDMELTSIEKTNDETGIATFDLSETTHNLKIPLESIGVVLEQQPTRQWKITGLDEKTLTTITAVLDN